MKDRLQPILASVRARLEARRGRMPLRELAARAADQPPCRGLAAALRRRPRGGDGAAPLKVMGELKRRSPSAGTIYEELDAPATARALVDAGCVALSVLTEEDHFGGSLDTLADVRAAVDVPLLRKDFLLDVYQVVEARAFGADAVLLLARVLDDDLLAALRDRAGELSMEVLAEAYSDAELERLLRLDLPLVGVNARDLETFAVDLDGALLRAACIPDDRVAVAESGVRTRADAVKAAAAPIDAVLVGEGLMRGGTPVRRFAELFGAEAGS